MAISINEVKAIYQAACENELPEFINRFGSDERASVQKLVISAEKKLVALEREKQRIWELQKYEREYDTYQYICGIDEVGRGPLAGPVVAGAVIMPKNCDILYINDSKQLSEKKREELYDIIMEKQPDILLNDAVNIPQVSIRQVPIIKGDAKSISIAAASIIAKVTRDRLMADYAHIFPEYDFAGNKGYGSAAHIEALKKYGPTPIHRKSFIKNFL